MKKKFAKEIRKVAATLPVIFRNTHEVHLVTGQELIDQDINDINGVPIKPEGKYLQPMPVQIAINHENALKEIYKKQGMQGIKNYSETAIAISVASTLQQ